MELIRSTFDHLYRNVLEEATVNTETLGLDGGLLLVMMFVIHASFFF